VSGDFLFLGSLLFVTFPGRFDLIGLEILDNRDRGHSDRSMLILGILRNNNKIILFAGPHLS
jgi:hypothetical protein